MVKKRTRVFKPRPLNNNSIDEGIKQALGNSQNQNKPMSFNPQQQSKFNPNPQQKSTFNPPNIWNSKQAQLKPQPMYQPPKFGQQEPEEEEDEPFWDGSQWEDWALTMYDNYPDTRQFLPEWFVKAVQEME